MCIRDRYWSKVYNFSRLYLSSITEVEEVVQEVFVKVWETRDFLRADDNFKEMCIRDRGIDAKKYQLLLIKKAVGTRLYSMANSFNHSSLKKRITDVYKRQLIILPNVFHSVAG